MIIHVRINRRKISKSFEFWYAFAVQPERKVPFASWRKVDLSPQPSNVVRARKYLVHHTPAYRRAQPLDFTCINGACSPSNIPQHVTFHSPLSKTAHTIYTFPDVRDVNIVFLSIHTGYSIFNEQSWGQKSERP